LLTDDVGGSVHRQLVRGRLVRRWFGASPFGAWPGTFYRLQCESYQTEKKLQ